MPIAMRHICALFRLLTQCRCYFCRQRMLRYVFAMLFRFARPDAITPCRCLRADAADALRRHADATPLLMPPPSYDIATRHIDAAAAMMLRQMLCHYAVTCHAFVIYMMPLFAPYCCHDDAA